MTTWACKDGWSTDQREAANTVAHGVCVTNSHLDKCCCVDAREDLSAVGLHTVDRGEESAGFSQQSTLRHSPLHPAPTRHGTMGQRPCVWGGELDGVQAGNLEYSAKHQQQSTTRTTMRVKEPVGERGAAPHRSPQRSGDTLAGLHGRPPDQPCLATMPVPFQRGECQLWCGVCVWKW